MAADQPCTAGPATAGPGNPGRPLAERKRLAWPAGSAVWPPDAPRAFLSAPPARKELVRPGREMGALARPALLSGSGGCSRPMRWCCWPASGAFVPEGPSGPAFWRTALPGHGRARWRPVTPAHAADFLTLGGRRPGESAALLPLDPGLDFQRTINAQRLCHDLRRMETLSGLPNRISAKARVLIVEQPVRMGSWQP